MTIFLIRHGSAGKRNDADPSDDARRLDHKGAHQAATIATLLGGEPISRTVSSPAVRCVETIEPLATTRGTPIERHSHLAEGTPIEQSWALVEGFAAAGITAAMCSHGDVIPDLVRRAQLRGMTVAGATGCSKGSIWALHWDGARFDRGTYTPVPKP